MYLWKWALGHTKINATINSIVFKVLEIYFVIFEGFVKLGVHSYELHITWEIVYGGWVLSTGN